MEKKKICRGRGPSKPLHGSAPGDPNIHTSSIYWKDVHIWITPNILRHPPTITLDPHIEATKYQYAHKPKKSCLDLLQYLLHSYPQHQLLRTNPQPRPCSDSSLEYDAPRPILTLNPTSTHAPRWSSLTIWGLLDACQNSRIHSTEFCSLLLHYQTQIALYVHLHLAL